MKPFLVNILLALVWTAVSGTAPLASFVIGFTVSYLALWWLWPMVGTRAYFKKLPLTVEFVLFFLWELVKSTLRVAYDVVTPAANRSPAVVAVPLDAQTDLEITLLANLVTLTPGTLSMEVSADRKQLYIHAMFVEDPQAFRDEIKQGFERRVLELLR